MRYFFIIKLILFSLIINTHLYSQDLIEDLNASTTLGDNVSQFSESINIISRSGKIFILSNTNQLLNKGDFITLSLKDAGPVARAVVAKNHDGQSGIKILKVYSLSRWNQLSKGSLVDILKGDDSFLFKPKKQENKEVATDEPKIESEADLFSDVAEVETDLNTFYKDSRLIKPDNVVTLGLSQFTFVDEYSESEVVGNTFSFTWGYQFSDNYWVEALYGRTLFDGYPDESSQTIVNNFTARLKYTFNAPLYSYFMPYIGFKIVTVSSPNAGVVAGDTDADQIRAEAETKTINDLKQSTVVAGVTVLKRLVPGWFFKADVGTDIMSLGVGVEF